MKTINESMIDYLDNFLEKQKSESYTSLDWLGKELNSTSITQNPMANGGVIRKDVLGNVYKSQAFTYSLLFEYSEDKAKMLNNGRFLEDLTDYVKSNDLPTLERNRIATKLEVAQTPFLSQVETDKTKGIYVVIIQLEYLEPNKAKGED